MHVPLRFVSAALPLLVASLAGCAPNVMEGAGDGLDPSSATTGTAAGPRAMEIDVAAESTATWCATWQEGIGGVRVFSNRADGSLLDEAVTDDAGRATLLTVDGGYASAVNPGHAHFPPTITSFAVTADLAHLHFGFVDDHTCAPAPMHVHVDVPPQPFAAPVVEVCDAWAAVDTTTWSAELDFVKCSYDGMFTVLLVEGEGYVPLVAASPATPWVEGGSATVAILPASANVDVRVLSKATDAAHVAQEYWDLDAEGTETLWPDAFAVEQTDGDALLTWRLRAAPGVHVQAQHAGGWSGPSWSIDADASLLAAATTTMDPARLAQPRLDPSGAWLLDDGDLGQTVVALRRFGTEDRETWWRQYLPASTRVTLPDLTLPPAVEHFFRNQPASRTSVDNTFVRGLTSYGDYVRLDPTNSGSSWIEETNTGCVGCPSD